MTDTFTLSTMHQAGMQLMSLEDLKKLLPKQNAPHTKTKAERQKISQAMRCVHACCDATLKQIQRHFDGATLDRDSDLRAYAKKIHKRIIVDNGRWLPKYVFRDRPTHLFWVEGESRAILYNYIPDTDKNVFLVAGADFILHYDILIRKLQFIKELPRYGRVICENTMVFATDIVQTKDPLLAEVHAKRIEYFSKNKGTNE